MEVGFLKRLGNQGACEKPDESRRGCGTILADNGPALNYILAPGCDARQQDISVLFYCNLRRGNPQSR